MIILDKYEKLNVAILILLYGYQGMVLGLVGAALVMVLIDKNIQINQIEVFSACFLPFSFKFIVAPFLDYFHIERLGKRKTYIVPI